ncbi:hypothetical protein RB596_009079 [Gaeumannomyces avenae]
MDSLPNPLPLTEANLAEQQKNLPERRLDKAKREVRLFLVGLCFTSERRHAFAPARCQLYDAESVYITDLHELDYRGSQEPKPDLEDPAFWERRLAKFQSEYQPIVSLEQAKSGAVSALMSIYYLGRAGREFLKDYEIYLEKPKDDIRQLRHRSKEVPAPDLESVDFWNRHTHYLKWKCRQIERQIHRRSGSPSPEPIWPPLPPSTSRTASFVYENPGEVVNEGSANTFVGYVSHSSSVKFRHVKRWETMKAWVQASPTVERSLAPPVRKQPSCFYETNIQSSAKPLDENMWIPDPTLPCLKRDRARGRVRDLLRGLQDHCGEAGRRFAETADVYIAADGNVAHRRGQNAANAIIEDPKYWEEQEKHLFTKYQQLLPGILSGGSDVRNKGSKRRLGDDRPDSSTSRRKRARPSAPAVVAAGVSLQITPAGFPTPAAPAMAAGLRRSTRITAAKTSNAAAPAVPGLRRSARIAAKSGNGRTG